MAHCLTFCPKLASDSVAGACAARTSVRSSAQPFHYTQRVQLRVMVGRASSDSIVASSTSDRKCRQHGGANARLRGGHKQPCTSERRPASARKRLGLVEHDMRAAAAGPGDGGGARRAHLPRPPPCTLGVFSQLSRTGKEGGDSRRSMGGGAQCASSITRVAYMHELGGTGARGRPQEPVACGCRPRTGGQPCARSASGGAEEPSMEASQAFMLSMRLS